VPNWDEFKKNAEKGLREYPREKHTHIGKNNRLGEILQFMEASNGWTTIKMLAEHFGWTDQEAARKMSYYAKNDYVKVSDHIKTSGRPLSIYTIADKGSQVLGNYIGRTGG